jgi:hypothetical protein
MYKRYVQGDDNVEKEEGDENVEAQMWKQTLMKMLKCKIYWMKD